MLLRVDAPPLTGEAEEESVEVLMLEMKTMSPKYEGEEEQEDEGGEEMGEMELLTVENVIDVVHNDEEEDDVAEGQS